MAGASIYVFLLCLSLLQMTEESENVQCFGNLVSNCTGPYTIQKTTTQTCAVNTSLQLNDCIRECIMMFCCRAGSVETEAVTGVTYCVLSHQENHNMQFIKKVPIGTRECVEGSFQISILYHHVVLHAIICM